MILLLLTGCMTLDGFFFDSIHVDSYDVSHAIVPEALTENVTFEASDGTVLHGIWAHQDPPAPPMIFFHGNYHDITDNWDRVETYWSWHTHDVLIFDYRCYGMSDGVCTYDGVLHEDGLAAVQYTADTTGYAPEDIPWMGHSLGASVATHTSAEIGAQSIVLESMFASAGDLADDGVGLDLPSGWFFADPFDNVGAAAEITAPVFVVHGLADDYILPEYADRVYAAAPDPKDLWKPEGVGHSDIITVIPEEYEQRITAWQAEWR